MPITPDEDNSQSPPPPPPPLPSVTTSTSSSSTGMTNSGGSRPDACPPLLSAMGPMGGGRGSPHPIIGSSPGSGNSLSNQAALMAAAAAQFKSSLTSATGQQ